MKLKLNQLIEVEWDDIVSDAQWISQRIAETIMPCRCKSIGYFLNQDNKVIRLSCTIQFGVKTERDITVIPQGCITKIRRLKCQ